MTSSVHPFQISIEDKELEELSQRLSFAKFPTQLEGSDNWTFGVPVEELKRLVTYWKNEFNWRKVEEQLNELPNFKTEIEVDGFGALDIHCKSYPIPISRADLTTDSRPSNQPRQRSHSPSLLPWLARLLPRSQKATPTSSRQ